MKGTGGFSVMAIPFLDHKSLISGAIVFKCSSETSKMHYTKWFHFVVCGFYHCYGDGFDLYLKQKELTFATLWADIESCGNEWLWVL